MPEGRPMYCQCGKQASAGYTAMPEEGGGFNYHFWVCANCHKPSFLVFEKVTYMHVPKRATAILSVVGTGDGRNMLTWATAVSGERIKTMTFNPYPRKVDMVDQGRDVCLELWRSLDAKIDTIRGPEPTDTELHKEAALTYAKVIALVMSPFYADQQAVLAESMNRWKARQEGRDHESPGLAESIWDPATRFDGTPYSKEAEAKARTRGAKPKVKLDDQKINFIKHCLENGTMTPEVLAGMFDVSVDDIKAVVS